MSWPPLKITLFLFVLGCAPISTSQPPRPFLFLAEGTSLIDFADQLDSADVLALSGRNGRAEGKIDFPEDNQADRDVLRVIATPGTLLRLELSSGSAGAALRPFLVVTDSLGEVLGLHDGAAERSSKVQVVVPTQASLFVVLQDSKNANQQGLVGGNAFSYTLTLSEEPLNPEALGPISTNVTSINSGLSPDAGLALFSFEANPGKKYSILVEPARLANPLFVPFLAIYSPSFELGAVAAATNPRQSVRSEFFAFGSGQEEILFGVSDFSGGFGDDYSFAVSIREEP
jgi:hypothetical protein